MLSMTTKTKKSTFGVSGLSESDLDLVQRLKIKTKVFQTSALFRLALQALAKAEGVNGRAK
jgi:hypothetical protein